MPDEANSELVIVRCPGYELLADEEFGHVRLVDDNGERVYWDSDEWEMEPRLTMGAILNVARLIAAGNISREFIEKLDKKIEAIEEMRRSPS
jgi:hypothetical protein